MLLTVSPVSNSCRFTRPMALHYAITTPRNGSPFGHRNLHHFLSKLHHIPLTMHFTEKYRSKTFRLETGFDRSSEFCHPPPFGEYGRRLHYAEFACFLFNATKHEISDKPTNDSRGVRSKTDRKMLTFARIKAQTAIKKTYTNNIISRNIRSGGSHT